MTHKNQICFLFLGCFLALIVVMGVGCSSTPPARSPGPGNSTGGLLSTGTGGVSATGGATGGTVVVSGGMITGLGGGGGSMDTTGILSRSCASEPYEAKQSPLTIYTLFDDSVSMFPWWLPTTTAFIQFAKDPSSDGINVGLKYFGRECDANFYAMPDIPIESLPANAMAIENNLAARFPVSGTATTPALQGALTAAQARKSAFPEETVIILLVTDGSPSNCDSTLENASEAARVASTQGIPVYVLGLGDVNGLNQLAQAGGTGDAIVVDPKQSDQVVAAMNEIRGRALPCDYRMPDGGQAMKGLVNLVYEDANGQSGTIPGVQGPTDCDGTRGGWYLADTEDRLVVCPSTCDAFKNGFATRIDVVLGCPTEILM